MNKNPLGALGVIICIAASLGACRGGDAVADETDAPVPVPVLVATAEIADISATYQTTATIASDAEAPILARVGGEVAEILVEEGDVVSKGQILARLDGDRLRLEMLKAKAEYEMAKREYERTKNLHARDLVSTAQFEDLRFDMDALEASYELKRLNYDYTMIRATIGGVVSSRDVKVGTNVEAGMPAFKVTDTTRLVAYLSIPQTELYKFSSGDEAAVSVDSAPDVVFGATIARLSPTIDTSSGTFRATVYVDNDHGELAPGMFGRFTIAYDKHVDAVVVPVSAVVHEDNETTVYVVENGAAARRRVRTGIESDGMVEILDGLNADEHIVLTGQSRLRDGSPVLASIGAATTGTSG